MANNPPLTALTRLTARLRWMPRRACQTGELGSTPAPTHGPGYSNQ